MPILDVPWSIRRTAPGAIGTPVELDQHSVTQEVSSCMTVASALSRSASGLDPDNLDIDSFDWWYDCEFAADTEADLSFLTFGGLATLAEVWFNGEKILSSENMFVSHTVNVTHLVRRRSSLAIVFRSVTNALEDKRPRPHWKTNLVDHQQLRWIRTTLLGRIPGWTPRIRAIGPWRNIAFRQSSTAVTKSRISTSVVGNNGRVGVDVTILAAQDVSDATFEIDGQVFPLEIVAADGQWRISGVAELKNVSFWYPHTHGDPALYDYQLVLSVDNAREVLQVGKAGFRQVSLVQNDDKFAFVINNEDVFCRGACWTTADIFSLNADREYLKKILGIAADAGTNMIRIGGTMVYESRDFYEICDELGIMVWQDFMFANMDYPIADNKFRENVDKEIFQQIERLADHSCVVAFCGNSEVEQQAAMFGRPAKDYRNELFYKIIPEQIAKAQCEQPYIASSPTGGALPFHNGSGVSHYFGIGAYKRPLSDVASTRILFTSECLGFSNIPSDESMRAEFGSAVPATHSSQWKAAVPRDTGAGWDFEDIRDHYFEELSGQNASNVRYSDNAAYLARSGRTTGEVMLRTYAHWRTARNACNGALVWNMMDIVPGAGWGLIDANGTPKPVLYYLKRAWAPRGVSLIDTGLDGLLASVVNESADEFHAKLDVQVLRLSHIAIASCEIDVVLAPRSDHQYSLDGIIGHFLDTNYSYRFGPLGHDVVAVTLKTDDGSSMTDAYFPGGYTIPPLISPKILHRVTVRDNTVTIELSSDSFLQDVAISAAGYEFSDNFFHLAPGINKTVVASAENMNDTGFRGVLRALNLASSLHLKPN